MEVFGHAFSGVLLAQILEPGNAKEKPAWVWPVLGAVAALSPDVDGFTILGGADAFKRWHQLYTHNAVAFAVAPPLIALAANRLTRGRFGFPALLALFWIGMALHLAGDLIAHWPLKFFYPFSGTGWSFRLLPRDFSIGLALILMLASLAGYVDQVAPWRRVIAAAGLVAGVLYVTAGPGW